MPPLLSERSDTLDPARNPFYQHARVELFLARRDGDPVGTIAAFSNHLYNEFHEANVGWFGFFEVLPDGEAAAALLAAAEGWARRAGHASILGPAQFSTNDEVGLLVDGFDDPPRVLMTYNPPRYRDYLEQAGFGRAKDLLAYRGTVEEVLGSGGPPEKLMRVIGKIRDRGRLRVRTVRLRDFDRELERVKVLYNQSWARNWGFVPMTDDELEHMARRLRPLIDPDLVPVVEVDGEVVGFGLTLPDVYEPMRLAYPRPGKPEWISLVQLLWHWKVRRRARWIRAFALGVLPEYRGMGVDGLLYLHTMEAALRKGYRIAEMSWVLEDNEQMNRAIRMFGVRVYKTYRVYEKTL